MGHPYIWHISPPFGTHLHYMTTFLKKVASFYNGRQGNELGGFMQKRENALLLFAKLPRPGEVKTRLSVLKDGVFSPEDASDLFEAMLLDVVGICLGAFDILEKQDDCHTDAYRLYISTAPSSNAVAMSELIEKAGVPVDRISFIGDRGSSFDEHYNDAFAKVWADGANCILSMGADMPALSVWDVVRGFEALHELEEKPGGLVVSPDQAMGVSIIGWTANTDFDHTGVFYNESGLTVLPAYIDKARAQNLPVIMIPPVPDVDTIADLAHNITLLEAAEYASHFDGSIPAKRTIAKLRDLDCYEVRVPPNELRDSRDVIDQQ